MKKIVFAACCGLLFAPAAFAQNDPASTPAIAVSGSAAAPGDNHTGFSDIPLPLLKQIQAYGQNQYIEQYVERVLGTLRRSGRDPHQIDKQDAEKVRKTALDRMRREHIQQILTYDQNFDGKVTRDEITEAINDSFSGQRRRLPVRPEILQQSNNRIDTMMADDLNHDGAITLDELDAWKPKENTAYIARMGADLDELLALDPNKDGVLTASELEVLARKAFSAVDKDNDGIIVEEEAMPLREIVQQARALQVDIAPTCSLPRPEADERIVFLGAYEGVAVSNVSVAGQVAETDVIPVDIEKAEGKLYIIADAFSPVIWQFTGATERIGHLVLAGPSMAEGTDNNDMGNGKVNAGETGVASARVTFRHARDCGLLSSYKEDVMGRKVTANVIARLTGRTPEENLSSYSIAGAHIGQNMILPYPKDFDPNQRKAPAGFDTETWNRHLQYMPGGLINLKKVDVVSDAPAADYLVLPKWAGISKLVAEKALEPLEGRQQTMVINSGAGTTTLNGIENVQLHGMPGNVRFMRDVSGFRIVKDIPYYPSGLYGGFSTTFHIAKGVKTPKGSPGHSCVMSEETGQAVAGNTICH